LKITLITVCYNSKETIEKTILSVISQSYINYEYIIIDGDSNDGTQDIIKKYQKSIKLFISEKDNGIYSAINKGILKANGDYIGLLHSNDIFENCDTLKNIVYSINKYKTDILYSNIIFINENLKKIRFYSSKYFRPWMFRFGFQPAHTSLFVKTEIYKKNLYNENYIIASDFEFLLKLIYIQKYTYKFIDETWIKMKIGGKSTSGFKNLVILNNEINIICRNNNLYTNHVFIYMKYIIKWFQFFQIYLK
jgi:glycosyltransferase involved in cell wall biosynthesis